MNQVTSAPGASLLPDSTDIFTIGHLAIIAVLALLVVAGLVWGIRNARLRRESAREIAEHNATVVADAPAPPPPSAPPSVPREEVTAGLPPVSARETPPPPAATPEFEAAPVIAASPELPAQAETAGPSPANGPVTQLKGLGPKLATQLADLGITTVGQIAALTDDEAAALDARLGAFTGRMNRDRWQEQARFLAAGDKAGFEAVFGRL